MTASRLIIRWALAAALMTAFLALPAMGAEDTPPDTPVVRVNGQVVTWAEFQNEMGRLRQRYYDAVEPVPSERMENLEKIALDNLVNRTLILQEARRRKVTVDPARVDEALATIKSRFKGEDEFREAIGVWNQTEEQLKEDIRRDLLVESLINKEFYARATATDSEVKEFYSENPDYFIDPEKVRARHILVSLGEYADDQMKAEAKERIKEILKKLKAGEDFEALALSESDDSTTRMKGGDLGYFTRGQMEAPFEEAAFSLKKGQISGIVETRFGYHLIQLVDRKLESLLPLDSVKDKIVAYLVEQKVEDAVARYLDDLRSQADIEVLLKPAGESK